MSGWIDAVVAFVQAHGVWAAPIAGALAFTEGLAFVALAVPGMTILFGIGALVGASEIPFVPVWLGIGIGAALGHWVSYAIGFRLKDGATRIGPLRRHPEIMARAARFFARWGVMSVVLCRFVGPLRATVPLLCGVFEMGFWPFQIANWLSAFVWAGLTLAPGSLLVGWLGTSWLG